MKNLNYSYFLAVFYIVATCHAVKDTSSSDYYNIMSVDGGGARGLIPAIILEIVAPILIIIGYQTKIAAAALSVFCIATAIIFHNNLGDQMQFIAFMKNIALAGGFLFLVVNGAKGYCLDKK